MLICTACNIEYKEDRKFCKHCGDPLVPKMEPVRPQKKVKKPDEEASDGKLICPQCKFVYEFGNSCIQCGVPLVRENAVQTAEESAVLPKKAAGEKASSQEQKDPSSRKIRFCPVCKIIYESGDSCIKCGAALVSQLPVPGRGEPKTAEKAGVEEKAVQLQSMQEQLADPPRQKFICPVCKIIYERKTSCIRCRSDVIPQDEFLERQKEKEEEKKEEREKVKVDEKEKIDLIDVETGFNEIVFSEQGRNPQPAIEKKDEIPGKQPSPAKPEMKEPVYTPKPKKQEFSISIEEELFQDQPLEQGPFKKTPDLGEKKVASPKKAKKDYRRLILELGSITIMTMAGAYFFWLIISSLIAKQTETRIVTPRVNMTRVSPISPLPTAPTTNGGLPVSNQQGTTPPDTSKAPLTEAQEIDNIKSLLENIRQANLEKDIDLFMSCYTTDFKNREEKKRSTLLNWKKYDYLSLSYKLKNPDISPDSAKVSVEWTIKIYPKSGGRSIDSRSNLYVLLEKEEGRWKIKELKQIK